MTGRAEHDDPHVVEALRSSVIVRLVGGALAELRAAAGSSIAVGWIARWRRRWLAESAADRRRAAGVAIIVATVTHVVLLVTHETPPGWLWLAPPVLTMIVGGLCLLPAAEQSEW